MNNYVIYSHILPNNKIYIGITCQKPKKRWNNGKGYAHNKYFINAINKYGWGNIKHEILYTNLSEQEAKDKEVELIALYKSNNPKYGYNISMGGDFSTKGLHTNLGIKRTKEQRENASIRMKGKYKGEKNPMFGKKGGLSPNYGKKLKIKTRIKMSKKIYQFDLNGKFIKQWFGIREASYKTGIDSGTISNCCNKIKSFKTAGGYIWSFEPKININDYIDNKKCPIIQIDYNDKKIKIWESISQIAINYNINKSSVYKWINKNKMYRGYYWRYLNEQK